MNTVAKLRAGFLARSRREKVLAVAFLIVLAVIWLSSLVSRAKSYSAEIRIAKADANDQAQWLDNAETIEARYNEAVSLISDAALPTRSEVLAQIDALVRKYQFTFRIDPPRSQSRDRLTFHSIAVNIDKGDFDQLQSFQAELVSTLPTVNLEQITLAADSRNPSQLNARLRLVAVEFQK